MKSRIGQAFAAFVMISIAAISIHFITKPARVVVNSPKYKIDDCVAYYMNGKHTKAVESWEVDQDNEAFLVLKIVQVGKEKYLTNVQYNPTLESPYPYRTDQSEWISSVDRDSGGYELIDCENTFKVFGVTK